MKNSTTPRYATLTFFTLCLLFSFVGLSCSEDSNEVVEEPEEPIQETFDGNYIGGWWSNAANGSVYVNYPISAIIKPTDDEEKWVGEFFYTRNFTSCCSSSPNDGTISFSLKEGAVTEFKYVGNLPDCDGNFSGEGEVDASGKIIIKITGSDCEGSHSNARIELSK